MFTLIRLFFLAHILVFALIIIAVIIACVGLYHLIKWLSIAHVKNDCADSLFEKAARSIFRSKSMTVNVLKSKLGVDAKRVRYIVAQLEISKLARQHGYTIQCEEYDSWTLESKFRDINSSSDYFKETIVADIQQQQERINAQLSFDTVDERRNIAEMYHNALDYIPMMNYLSVKIPAINTNASQTVVDELKKEYDNLLIGAQSLNNNILVDSDVIKSYKKLCDEFVTLSGKGLWIKGNHKRTGIGNRTIGIKVNGIDSFPVISYKDKEFYFLPAFSVVINHDDESKFFIDMVEYCSFDVAYKDITESMITANGSWFNSSEAEYLYTTYEHMRVNGGPDRRYKYNPSYAHYGFKTMTIASIGLDVISGTRTGVTAWVSALEDHKTEIAKHPDTSVGNGAGAGGSSLVDPDLLSKMSDAIVSFNLTKQSIFNGKFVSVLNDIQVFNTPEEKLYARILRDAIKADVVAKYMEYGKDSDMVNQSIDSFASKSGYDTVKIQIIINTVDSAFNNKLHA